MQIRSSTVQCCESPPYWIHTGVSLSNLIQNGFGIKQHSFVPNKELWLPAWGQKKMLGAKSVHHESDSLHCCSKNKLGRGPGGVPADRNRRRRCQTSVLSGVTWTRSIQNQNKKTDSYPKVVINSAVEFSDKLRDVQCLL